jgi:hypothetical protein
MRVVGLFCAIALSLVAAACSSPVHEAENAVRAQLTDPQSAQFRNIVQKGEYICGEVNSKNQQGGYAGFRHFYIAERGKGAVRIDPRSWATPATREMFGAMIGPDNDTPAFEEVYNRVCA